MYTLCFAMRETREYGEGKGWMDERMSELANAKGNYLYISDGQR